MRRIPRLWRPRSVGLFLLVLALAGFSGVFSAYHCCGVGEYCPDVNDPLPGGGIYNPPPPPPPPPPTWTVYRSQLASPWLTTDGQYGIHITSQAHALRSDGYKKLFDTRNSTNLGQELCAGTPVQTDWSDFGSILDSPEQEEPQGAYGVDDGIPIIGGELTCPAGQALVWTWGFDTKNGNPYVAEQNTGDYACHILKNFQDADPGLAGC